jgi:hypothetical protein
MSKISVMRRATHAETAAEMDRRGEVIDKLQAALAAERERCARICEMHTIYYAGTTPMKLMPSVSGDPIGHLFAAAIRSL